MTREETAIVLGILKVAYPQSYKDLTKRDAENTITLWATMFSDTDVEVVKLALYRQIATGKFPPTISEMKELIGDISGASLPTAAEAWGMVTTAIRQFGYMEERQALTSLPPTVAEAIQSMGGWMTLCQSEEPMVDRAHFLKIYPTIEKRQKEKTALPEILSERIKLLAGERISG